jgi:ribonuclease HI
MYQLRFDGMFRRYPNTDPTIHAGFMGYGWIISRNNVMVAVGHGVFAHGKNATSGAAEYLALIEGLEALLDLGVKDEPVEIMGDARCVIDQVQGQAGIHSVSIKPLYHKVLRLTAHFTHLKWTWTARKHNRLADSLTRRAINRLERADPSFRNALKAAHPDRKPSRAFLALSDFRMYRSKGLQYSAVYAPA